MEPQDSNPHRRLKVFGTLAVTVVGIGLAAVLVMTSRMPESQTATPKPPSVEVQIAEETQHTYRIQSQGTALPRTSIRLVSEGSGRVVSIADSFDAGQVFAKDDVLLTIDPRDYELALMQAKAQVAQAELRLLTEINEAEIVRREWQLLKQEEPTGLQAREPQLATARAALEAAKATEQAAKRNLERCEIRAPFDGMVAKAGVRPGQFVALAAPLGELLPPMSPRCVCLWPPVTWTSSTCRLPARIPRLAKRPASRSAPGPAANEPSGRDISCARRKRAIR